MLVHLVRDKKYHQCKKAPLGRLEQYEKKTHKTEKKVLIWVIVEEVGL